MRLKGVNELMQDGFADLRIIPHIVYAVLRELIGWELEKLEDLIDGGGRIFIEFFAFEDQKLFGWEIFLPVFELIEVDAAGTVGVVLVVEAVVGTIGEDFFGFALESGGFGGDRTF